MSTEQKTIHAFSLHALRHRKYLQGAWIEFWADTATDTGYIRLQGYPKGISNFAYEPRNGWNNEIPVTSGIEGEPVLLALGWMRDFWRYQVEECDNVQFNPNHE